MKRAGKIKLLEDVLVGYVKEHRRVLDAIHEAAVVQRDDEKVREALSEGYKRHRRMLARMREINKESS